MPCPATRARSIAWDHASRRSRDRKIAALTSGGFPAAQMHDPGEIRWCSRPLSCQNGALHMMPEVIVSSGKTIGVLTSGGDCAGLNAVIRAVVARAILGYGWRVLGLHQGTHGLLRR